jgi:hypothetical protein
MPEETKTTGAEATTQDGQQASMSPASGAQISATSDGKTGPTAASVSTAANAAAVERALAKERTTWGREKAELQRKHDQEVSELRDRMEFGDDVDKLAEARARRAMEGERHAVEMERVEARKERLLGQGMPEELVSLIDSMAAAEVAGQMWILTKSQLQTTKVSDITDEGPPQEITANPGSGVFTGPALPATTKEAIQGMADGDIPFDAKKASEVLHALGIP